MSEARTDLTHMRASYLDAMFYSLMVGAGESYLVAFALASGLGEKEAGLLACLPILFGAVVQLFAGACSRFMRLRRFIVMCASVQAASLAGIAITPHVVPGDLTLALFFWASLYWAAAFSAGPAWNLWICRHIGEGDIIPFFARRTRIAQLFILLGLVAAGSLLQVHKEVPFFSMILLFAACCRVVSAIYIHRQRRAQSLAGDLNPEWSIDFWPGTSKLKLTPSMLKVMAYLFLMQFAVHISAPYFNPYMLKSLALDYGDYTVLIGTAFLSRVLFADVFTHVARRYGARPLVIFGATLIAPISWLWTLSDSFVYLIFMQVISGIAWGAHELGLTFYFLGDGDERNRSLMFTLNNLVTACGVSLGGIVGASLLTDASPDGLLQTDYFFLFAVSSCVRIIPVAAFFALKLGRRRFTNFYSRILSVRPGAGVLSRPVFFPTKGNRKGRKVS